MKFTWKILTENSLWSQFFRAKYIEGKHISLVDAHKGSQFWKDIMLCLPQVLSNARWWIRDGNIFSGEISGWRVVLL